MISSDGLGPSIGPYRLRNPVVLAPMAGVTDAPFRACAGVLAWAMWSPRWCLQTPACERRENLRCAAAPLKPAVRTAFRSPVVIPPAWPRRLGSTLRKGRRSSTSTWGAPQKKVCNKAAGSALLKDEGLVAEILKATVAAVSVPVTLKIRTGWSPEHRNGVRVARLAEDAGIAALAVHGRTPEPIAFSARRSTTPSPRLLKPCRFLSLRTATFARQKKRFRCLGIPTRPAS